MVDTWLPINNGRQQSSYHEFQIKLEPGGIYVLNNPFNYFRCLDANQPFLVSWSTNTGQTNFQSGLGIKFDDVIPYAQIFNESSAPLVLSVGVGIGYFDDSRLSVSGTVKTEPASYSFFETKALTFGADGVLTIPPAQKIIIQNVSPNTLIIGSPSGLQLLQYGTFECSLNADLKIYGPAGAVIAVGSFS